MSTVDLLAVGGGVFSTVDLLAAIEHRSSECCIDRQTDYVRCRLAGRLWDGTEPCCIARKVYDKRTSGMFKVEWSGDGSWGWAGRRTIATEPSTSTAPKT